MKPILIRPATPTDYNGVTVLLKESYPQLMASHYNEDILSKALPNMTTAQPKLLESGTFYVAEEEQEEDFKEQHLTVSPRLLGCGGWTPVPPGDSKKEQKSGLGHIRHFAVHPDATRRGIGRALLQRCKDEAVNEGITEFLCFSSLNAEPFYNSFGFGVTKYKEIPLGDGILFPIAEMSMSLV